MKRLGSLLSALFLVTAGTGLLLGGWLWLDASHLTAQTAGPVSHTVQVTLPVNAPYKVKRSLDVLGVQMVQVKHRPSSQEFIVLSGVNPQQSATVFNQPLTPSSVQSLGNNALRIIKPGFKDALVVDAVENVPPKPLELNGKPVPQRAVRVRFHLSSDNTPKTYTGTMGRLDIPRGKETVVVTFGREETFQPELLSHFLKSVSITESAG
jgi:hypothetical protein